MTRTGPPCSFARGLPFHLYVRSTSRSSQASSGKLVLYSSDDLKRTNFAEDSGFTTDRMCLKLTPSHSLSNRLQLVTQWKSETSLNWGWARNSSQVHVMGLATNPPMVSFHSESRM